MFLWRLFALKCLCWIIRFSNCPGFAWNINSINLLNVEIKKKIMELSNGISVQIPHYFDN